MNNIENSNNYNLFKLVWNNKYIRYNIINHLKLYNLFLSTRYFESIEELLKFEFKDYLYSAEIKNYDNEIYGNLELKLPNNVEVINYYNGMGPIPKTIKKVYVNHENFKYYSKLFTNTNLESVLLDCSGIKSKSNLNFPNSVTELTLTNPFIKANTLPSNLQTLVLYKLEANKIQKRALPESLIKIKVLKSNFMFPLEEEYLSTPQLKYLFIYNEITLTQDLTFLSNLQSLKIECKELTVKLPASLKYLYISTCYIEDGVLNEGLEILKIYEFINLQTPIKFNENSFPNSLVELEILNITQITDDYDKPILPNSLKKLSILGGFNKKLKKYQLPSSLTHLEFNIYFSRSIFNNGGEALLEEGIFPSTLIHLCFGSQFNQTIGENVLPINLKVLNMGRSFNKQFQKNVLPQNLEILVLGYCNYDQEIIENSIPFSTKIIHIQNKKYKRFPIKLKDNQKTIIHSKHNYLHYQYYPESLTSLKLFNLKDMMNRYSFENKLNLEYLDLDATSININDLPINNNIKTLVIDYEYIIDLSRFQKLEIIKIKSYNIQTRDIIKVKNNNFYNLKEIQIEYHNSEVIDKINPIFHQFIKLLININCEDIYDCHN